MRILQLLVFKLISFLVLLLGLLLLAELWTDVFPPLLDRIGGTFSGWADWIQTLVWIVGAVVLVAIGLIGLLPALGRRRGRQISFEGPHGDVSIQLDSVEATLNRVVSKMPEVNKIHARVLPSDENRRVEVTADVVLNKLPGVGAREIARRVSNQIRNTAVHILGVDEVTSIRLDVSRIVVDLKKPMEIPEETAAIGQAGLAASAVGMGPVTTIEGVEEAEEELAESREGAAEATPAEDRESVFGGGADRYQEEAFEDRDDAVRAADLETADPEVHRQPLGLVIDDEEAAPDDAHGDREAIEEGYGIPLSQERVEEPESEGVSPWERPFEPEDRPYGAEQRIAEADEALPPLDEVTQEAEDRVELLPEPEEQPLLPTPEEIEEDEDRPDLPR